MLGAALTNCAMGNYEADYDEFMSISVPNRYVITGTTTQMCCLKTGGGGNGKEGCVMNHCT